MPSYTPRASMRRRENRSRRFNADVAQLVEQLTRNEQVVRSNRIVGSTLLLGLRGVGAARRSPRRRIRRVGAAGVPFGPATAASAYYRVVTPLDLVDPDQLGRNDPCILWIEQNHVDSRRVRSRLVADAVEPDILESLTHVLSKNVMI